MRGLRFAVGLIAVSALLASCGLASFFYPPIDYSNPSFDPSDPDFSFEPFSSEAMPTFLGHGTATITITSGEPRVVKLTHLSGDNPSMVMPGLGAYVSWRGGDWGLKVEGGSGGLGLGLGAQSLTIIREDTDPPLQADGANCTITFSASTATHVAGRAVCKGLAWVAGFGDPMDLPVPSSRPTSGPSTFDHPLFDATIVFDATP